MRGIGSLLLFSSAVSAGVLAPRAGDSKKCPGYKAINIEQTDSSLTAQLRLAGKPCNTYGKDLEKLKLTVEYQTDSRLHVLIEDEDEEVYQVPESVFARPNPPEFRTLSTSAFTFSFQNEPFSFSISRKDTDEVLFDTTGSNLVFQDQYLKLRTSLPKDPNLYGLGEHTDSLRLNTTDYIRTLWNRDSYGIPTGTNLYGSHPIYVDHRGKAGSHGVFILNSNGMDILIDKDDEDQQYLEYNTLGGVFDFYFFAGPSPKEVSQQYAEVAGLPAMMPYWGFGFHQCRYGYQDAYNVAEVVSNYSKANIPLETMWTDIDYMDGRQIFTLDPERFPINEMRALVDYLHDHDQHYIVMVDPAVSTNEEDNPAYPRGVEQDVFLKLSNGSYYRGDVWPGVTVYPDWFNPRTGDYWTKEFLGFFDAESGVDIDALWIDMNEAANFCEWPCTDPVGWARDHDLPPDPPPVRGNPRPLPGFPPVFQPGGDEKEKRAEPGDKKGLPGRNLTVPPFEIHNEAGPLSQKTIATDLIHDNGLTEYDTHNLYGIMMSIASREAMLARRPSKRPLVITRSTFAGAGSHVGKWLGDNLSEWEQYRFSIAEQLAFAAIFQVPFVGSDVCGFGSNVTETLCARWATLGAFSPFYRNHNEITAIDQEFYRWPKTIKAAQNAIDIRYKLLDYIYTAFHDQTKTGAPLLNPMFYLYPEDENTFPIDLQFFYGDSILVSPVTEENSTSVDIYLPDDIFYEYKTGTPVRGEGDKITLDEIDFSEIPLHIRGGSIIPQRTESANTTTALRKKPFDIIIAPGLDGKAAGSLYIDDGESLEQDQTLEISFSYDNGLFKMEGKFGSGVVVDDVKIASIRVLGQEKAPKTLSRNGKESSDFEYNEDTKTVTAGKVDLPLTGPAEVKLG